MIKRKIIFFIYINIEILLYKKILSNDYPYYSFDYKNLVNKGNNKNLMNEEITIENDFIVKIICNIYNKYLNNQKYDIIQALININEYSSNNTPQKNIELIFKLVNIIPLIMKFFKENLPNFSNLKKKFELEKNIIKNEELEEEIKISSQELSKLCDGMISSTPDIVKIFQAPLGVVNKYTQYKFNIVQFQKEDFYNLLIEDDFLCKLRKDFEYVDKIIEILKNDFNIEKQESLKIKSILSKLNKSDFDEKEKEEIMDNIFFNVQNIIKKDKEIDIDDLVNYINEKDEKKTKKKKKNKKKKENIINDNIIGVKKIENKNNSIEYKNNEIKNDENIDDDIELIKDCFRKGTVNANNICKIKVLFSEKWVSDLGKMK